jgi:hypothetical protein
MTPHFDELFGEDLPEGERERLRRVHELLVVAGPPPELSPELEAGPSVILTPRGRERRPWPSFGRLALVAAAVLVAGFVGYALGNDKGFPTSQTIAMRGTVAAPNATGRLEIGEQDGQNWLMRLDVTGLPTVGEKEYYEVFLTRRGKRVAPCGWFRVEQGHSQTIAYLTAPYDIEDAGWEIARVHVGERGNGAVVMRTIRGEA